MKTNTAVADAVSLLTAAGYKPTVATLYPNRDIAIIIEAIPKDDNSGYNGPDKQTKQKE